MARRKPPAAKKPSAHLATSSLFTPENTDTSAAKAPESAAENSGGLQRHGQECAEIEGIIDRITYQDAASGFTVARLQASHQRGEQLTVVGHLAGVPLGVTVRLTGKWMQDPRHGRQFKADSLALIRPKSLHGIKRYLGSGLVKGVGPRFAGRIVERFGRATLDVLDQEPDRLREVAGLGPKRLARIKKAWSDQREIHRIMTFLHGYDISVSLAGKIYKAYGAGALSIIEQNPYRLSEEMWGVGFKTADRIARSIGVAVNAPQRVRAGLSFILSESVKEGHCFLDLTSLLGRCRELLGIDAAALEKQIPVLVREKKIVIEKEAVYATPLYFAEKGIAAQLLGLGRGTPAWAGTEMVEFLAEAMDAMGIVFDVEQVKALKTAIRHKVAVITGGPGTGKSTILRALLLVLKKEQIKTVLAAPTGRAAKRLAEATGREAKTIHRLLEFEPATMGFKRNKENLLEADVVIVDEVSMMDVLLANALLQAVPPEAALLLVGDADQLPPVGPGNVLRDILASGAVPVARLRRIFRQGPGSLISLNAARINRGEALELMPDFAGEKDFYCIFRETPAEIEAEIVSLCAGRLTKKYGFQPLRDIQVLTPMRKGIIGADSLNRKLQAALNPLRPEMEEDDDGRAARFRPGDKVMQIRNNYDKEVFNGDIGYVGRRDKERQALEVQFEGRAVSYEAAGLHELELAYAVTVHKAQGSEFSCIIMPIHSTHYPLLQRNLLYTGVTRGKKIVIVIGSKKAIALAIRNSRVQERNTRLKERLAAW